MSFRDQDKYAEQWKTRPNFQSLPSQQEFRRICGRVLVTTGKGSTELAGVPIFCYFREVSRGVASLC